MKVGMIFECCSGGADEKVYPYLARKIRSDLDIKNVSLDSKGKLRDKCGKVAKDLLTIDECDKILIIWDLHPPQWGDEAYQSRRNKDKKSGGHLCPVEDCKPVQASLKEACLTEQEMKKVHILCIVHELETLLLFDTQALSIYLSKRNHICEVKERSKPGRITRPKQILCDIFEQDGRGRIYDGVNDAEKLIKLINTDKLKRCDPYQKFKQRILSL